MKRLNRYPFLALALWGSLAFAQDTQWQPKYLEEIPARPHRIPKQLLDILRADANTDENGRVCEKTDVPQRSSLRFVKLASNGKEQVMMQGMGVCHCSPTGNCSFWIYEKEVHGYKLLLKQGAVQTFSIEDSRSHGYRDIVTGMHGSAFDTALTVFSFDGVRYQRRECWSMHSDLDGSKTVMKKRDCGIVAKKAQ